LSFEERGLESIGVEFIPVHERRLNWAGADPTRPGEIIESSSTQKMAIVINQHLQA
jgi:hypothetical protein